MVRKKKKNEIEIIEPKLNFFDNEKKEENEINNNILLEKNYTEKAEQSYLDSEQDLSNIFETVHSNVLHAKDIFNKNVEIKKELDNKFEKLEKKQIEIDNIQKDFELKQKKDYEKIKKYKDEVYEKVTAKKGELDAKIEELKKYQNKLNIDKEKFEEYKKNETERLKKEKKDNKQEYENQQAELKTLKKDIESSKKEIEEEKRKLDLDRIKYNSDKNELANNLLKFNELVSDFTVNIDKFNNENKPN